MGTHIKDLADESIVSILEYLRAADLVSTSEVSKKIFLKSFIRKAVIVRTDRRLSRRSATFWALVFRIPTEQVAALLP